MAYLGQGLAVEGGGVAGGQVDGRGAARAVVAEAGRGAVGKDLARVTNE
jgi:hypothetical protein